jgi:bifunctional DNA-binding transcriptional regulator/antitoxin component of YhaV-PrlF toxin-antitoxin module
MEEKSTRKLTRLGKVSLAVTLPVEMLRKLNWREKQKVVVRKIRGGLKITDWKKN